MSLQLWLPLTKDLRNQGLSNVTVTNNGATFNSAGKLGGCYYFNATSQFINLTNYMTILKTFTNYSMSAWVYIETKGSGHSATILSSGNWNKATGQLVFGFYSWDTDHYKKLLIPNTSGWFNSINYNFMQNTWYHITITYNGSKTLAYVNGIKIGEYNGGGIATTSETDNLYIGRPTYDGSYNLRGKLNDVRIYDHCLSPLEVKKISQGLVLHYRLSGIGGENLSSRYITPAGTSPTSTANGGRTIYNGDYSIKIPATENADTYFAIWLTEKPSDGEIYTLSAKVSGLLSGTYYRFPLFAQSNSAMGLWNIDHNGICSLTFTMNYTGTINTATVNGQTLYRMFMDDIARSIASGQGEILIENIKLEKGDHPTPWCPNSSDNEYSIMGLDDNIEYDCSGFGNNGTKIGDIKCSSDTPRYSGSYNILTNSYINCGRVGMPLDEITVSIWGYMDDWSQYQNSIFSCTESGGYAIQKSGSNLVFYIGTGISSNTYITFTLSASSLDSGWHMFSFTYDGLAACFYINGILEQKIDKYTTKTPLFYHPSNGLFVGAEAGSNQTIPAQKAFSGKISDFRVYATALSADDILDLYHLGGSIDSNGVFHTYEYVEGE